MTGEQATSEVMDPEDTLRLDARRTLYHFFSRVLSDPRSTRWADLRDQGLQDLAAEACRFIAGDPAFEGSPVAPGETATADLDLTAVLEALDRSEDVLEEEYLSVFGLLTSQECPPHEISYCPQTDTTYRSQQLADVSGFYSAFGLKRSLDAPDRYDHVCLELEFMSWLGAKQRHAASRGNDMEPVEICHDAQRRFGQDHLFWWVTAFCAAMKGRAEDREAPLYVAIAEALPAFLHADRTYLQVPPPTELLPPVETVEEGFEGCTACAPDPALNSTPPTP